MKKSFIIVVVLSILIASLFSLKAQDEQSKNLFNPNAFSVDENGLTTLEAISVSKSTSYVFSMPNQHFFGGTPGSVDIEIVDENGKQYIIEYIGDGDQCHTVGDRIACQFYTLSNANVLYFTLVSSTLKDYIDVHGFYMFQLEEGDVLTSYEPYVSHSNEPYFQGEGSLITSYITHLPLNQIIGTHITAYDEIDGDLTDQIQVEYDEYTGFETTVGSYEVMLSVEDNSQNVTQFKLTVFVVDDVAPVISGPSNVIVKGFSEKPLSTLIEDYFTFTDEIDGHITDYTVLSDDYTSNINQLGQHEVTIEVADSSGNKASKTFTITVEDQTKPSIIGPSTLLMNLSEVRNEETIISHFTFSDDYSSVENITKYLEGDILTHFSVPGIYETIVVAIDEAGNKEELIVSIEIYDDIPPELSGPEVIKRSYRDDLTMSDIINQLVVSDNYKTLTTNDIIVYSSQYDYTSQALGYFEIVFKVSDDNNTTTHIMYIHVVDDVAPVFNFSERIIVEVGTQLSVEQLLMVLKSHGELIDFDPVGLRYLENPYTLFEASGEASVLIELYNEHEETMLYRLSFEVIESKETSQGYENVLALVGLTILVLVLGVWLFKRR